MLDSFLFYYQDITVVFLLSITLNFLIIKTNNYHKKYTSDTSIGPQKIHSGDIPRIGGISLFLVLISQIPYAKLHINLEDYKNIILFLIVVSFPCFLFGFMEDVSNKINPLYRLIATLTSGLLGYCLVGYVIDSLSINFIDQLLSYLFIALIFQSLFVASCCNALNLIDGLNGLLAGICLLILFFFILISDIYNDLDLIKINIILFLAILGFFIFNWPKGLIFIGDGGAYLFGSIIGWMCILLTQKHPNIPFFYILCFICYPISEVIITFFRRILKTKNPMMPDDYHMHSMLYKLVNKKKMEKNFIHKFGIDSNSLTSIIIISFNLILGFIIYYGMPIILANEISHYIFLIEFLIFIIIFLLLKKYSPS